MTPFSDWAIRQNLAAPHLEKQEGQTANDSIATELFEGLMTALVDNLSSASAAQLGVTLDVMGKRWAEQQAERLTVRLQQCVTDVENRMTSALTEALRPALSDLHLRQTMQAFAEALRKLMPEFSSGKPQVMASPALYGTISELLAAERLEVDVVEGPAGEISVANSRVTLRAALEPELLNAAM